MSQIVPLTFEGAPVRAVVIAGEPLFVGKDVAERLGYADPTNAMKRHCKGVAFHHPLQTAAAPNRNRKITPEMLERISARMAAGATEYEAERAEGLSGSTLKVARSRARAKASARGVQVQ